MAPATPTKTARCPEPDNHIRLKPGPALSQSFFPPLSVGGSSFSVPQRRRPTSPPASFPPVHPINPINPITPTNPITPLLHLAYNITLSALHTKLILAHKRLPLNCPKPSLRPECAYYITLSALHTKLSRRPEYAPRRRQHP